MCILIFYSYDLILSWHPLILLAHLLTFADEMLVAPESGTSLALFQHWICVCMRVVLKVKPPVLLCWPMKLVGVFCSRRSKIASDWLLVIPSKVFAGRTAVRYRKKG